MPEVTPICQFGAKASDFKFKQGGSIVERNPYTHNMRAI